MALGGCLLLLSSVLVGGAINEGYSHYRDYVSALSGRGSTAAVVGIVGLLGFAAAHAAAGLSLRPYSRTAFVAFMLAATSGAVVALARISCPNGAARCSVDDTVGPDRLDLVHGFGVAAYEILFLVGVFAAAVWLLRSARAGPAAALVLLGVTSTALILSVPDEGPGTVQRGWLIVNAVAVVAVTVTAARTPQTTQNGRDDYGVSSV